MNPIVKNALDLFNEGYNCAQSVLMAFSEKIGMDRATACRIASGFGAGTGGLRLTCGAFNAMVAAYGMMRGYDPLDPKDKTAYYREIREMSQAFSARTGALDCATLLKKAAIEPKENPEPRSEAYYAKRPCAKYVVAAAEILSERTEGL